MGGLIFALLGFVGSHFLLSHPLRAPLVKRIGANAFLGLYSLVALATFYWVIVAFGAAPASTPLWGVGDGIWAVASALMLIGSILFAGSLFGNPALPRPDAGDLAKAPARGVFGITRHPMMWGFAAWSAVHIAVSPQEKVILLALAMGVLALGGSYGQDIKKAQLMGDGWKDWAARTSFMPFGNQIKGKTGWRSAWPGLTVVLAGTVLWLGASYLHPMLGAPVAGAWRWMGG
ncbi:MAG: NnrU family protein [Chakrabartia sp.]